MTSDTFLKLDDKKLDDYLKMNGMSQIAYNLSYVLNEAFINVAKCSYDYTYSFNERILTLCHELVHAKQFIKGELGSCGVIWKGVDYSLIRDLKNQPWEQEAFQLEVKLYNKYKDVLGTV